MPTAPGELIRAWFEEVWNQGKEEAVDRFLSPDFLSCGLPTEDRQPVRGPEGFKLLYRRLRGAFPDIKVELVHVLAEGDMAAAHCHLKGTHTGDTLGVPATGKTVDFRGVVLVKTRGDKIIEGHNYFDFLGMFHQIGLLPPMRI